MKTKKQWLMLKNFLIQINLNAYRVIQLKFNITLIYYILKYFWIPEKKFNHININLFNSVIKMKYFSSN